MSAFLLLMLAAAAQDAGPVIMTRDPPQGPMPGENRTLSQQHSNVDARMFPDIAVKDLRIDGDTLYVLVANVGGVRARGPIRITAHADANGVRSDAAPARLERLMAGESRWLPLRSFAVRTATSARAAPIFALEDASFVAAAVVPPAEVPAALDRSGRGADAAMKDFDPANNMLGRSVAAIARGRP